MVCDYIAGMSDSYAIDKFEEIVCAEGLERVGALGCGKITEECMYYPEDVD